MESAAVFRVLRSLHLSIFVSVLEGGDISAGSDTLDLLRLFNFDFLVFFSGIREGGDIPTGSAAVWWSPGSGGLLHHSLRGYLREDRHEGAEF
jgi:hypothetical protein